MFAIVRGLLLFFKVHAFLSKIPLFQRLEVIVSATLVQWYGILCYFWVSESWPCVMLVSYAISTFTMVLRLHLMRLLIILAVSESALCKMLIVKCVSLIAFAPFHVLLSLIAVIAAVAARLSVFVCVRLFTRVAVVRDFVIIRINID